jgi:hypothetical protein
LLDCIDSKSKHLAFVASVEEWNANDDELSRSSGQRFLKRELYDHANALFEKSLEVPAITGIADPKGM